MDEGGHVNRIAAEIAEVAAASGRRAIDALEAPPADPVGGYTEDEIAAHYAAVDRLVWAFKALDAEVSRLRAGE